MANPQPTKFSLSLGGSKKPLAGTNNSNSNSNSNNSSSGGGANSRNTNNAFSARQPSKRTHSTRALDGSDDEDEDGATQQPQSITSFGPGLNDSKPPPKPSLVIPAQKNRDWREESRRKRQRSGIPASGGKSGAGEVENKGGAEGGENDGVKGMPKSFGLTVMEKKVDEGQNGDAPDPEAMDTSGDARNGEDAEPRKERTADEEAMARLLGEKQKSNLIVPVSEEEAFQRDVDEAPDMASLDDYAAMPIEEFGSALLRGMGWKEGQTIGRKRGQAEVKPRVVQRRAALLGIGAKQDAAAGIELGAWGKGAKGGGKNIVRQEYTPVIMRNTKTGEQVTEEELRKKVEQQTLDEADRAASRETRRRSRERDSDYHKSSEKSSSRRHRHDHYDDHRSSSRRDHDDKRRDRSKDRDRDRNRETDSRKHRSSRRDRSASEEDHHRRRRDRSSSADSRDRRRRRERERDDRKDDRKDDHRHKDRRPRDSEPSYDRGSSRRDRRD